MKIFSRFVPLFVLLILGCTGAAWLNLWSTFPGWLRHTCFIVGSFSAVAFLLAFVGAQVKK